MENVMRQSTVRLARALPLVSGLIACGDRPDELTRRTIERRASRSIITLSRVSQGSICTTRIGIEKGKPFNPDPNQSSQSTGLQRNPEGSVELYIGPTAPAGKESNWVPTRVGGQFEVLFRVYWPEGQFFEKTWQRPDLEEAQ